MTAAELTEHEKYLAHVEEVYHQAHGIIAVELMIDVGLTVGRGKKSIKWWQWRKRMSLKHYKKLLHACMEMVENMNAAIDENFEELERLQALPPEVLSQVPEMAVYDLNEPGKDPLPALRAMIEYREMHIAAFEIQPVDF